ncbi:PAS domain-containing protein [Hymenobacter bucti]|uniref:histidine kinase n=1 Tax=Hymenobacter bucti TaxID=1844114 RepID=A0ABW4R0X3_9BACT
MPATSELVALVTLLPTPYLLLSPAFLIEAASEAYLAATLSPRERLVGRHLFDAFPDNPQTPEAQSVHNLRASLEQVLATGQPHEMAQQHYDVPDPARPGQFIERHWLPRNTPMLDPQGRVVYIVHSARDVTAEVQAHAHLRQSQAAEQAARVEAEAQRQHLHDILMQLPAQVATNRGPAHVFDLVNPRYQQQFPARVLQGLPVRQALPELAGQHFFELLDQVYQTGEPFYGHEMPAAVDYTNSGRLERRYFDVFFQALRDANGQIDGILNFAYDVSEQVRAREQYQQLNEELAATVEELRATTNEYQAANLALSEAQHRLQHLNQELEARVLARTRDVRQAQAETEAQRQRLFQLVAEAPALIATLRGPEHVVELANDGFRALFGGRAIVGKPYRRAVPELEGQPFFALLDNVYRTGETSHSLEQPMTLDRTNSGRLEDRYITSIYQATRDVQGQIDGILIFATDVTGQVLARQEREAQQRQFYAFFEQAPFGLCIFGGPDLVYEFFNPTYQLLLPNRDLVGRPLLAVMPELAGTPVERLLRRVYETGETQHEHELLIPVARPEDGELEERYFTIVYQARRDAQGRITGILNFTVEFTEQVRARQQVEALNQKLVATNAELHASNTQLTRTNVDLDTFVYTASHDLKAPITNIESIVLALRATLPPAVQQDELVGHLLSLLDTTVARFQFTIGQLTDISRLQLAHVGPAEPVVLAPVVEAVRLDLMPAIAAAGTQLTITVAPDLVVSFSPANLRSIVYNLLSNAIKYRAADRPSQVGVRATQTDHAVVLTVQDNGLGMSELQQRQLFGLFQRLHTHVEGTGVGLYITKRLVENGGGTIAVQSQPDAGTTFTVTFPA